MSEYVASGIPFYRSKEIINLHKNQNIQTELFISEERFDEINLKFGSPTEGDILLTSVGTLGIPYQVKKGDKFYFKDGNLTWFRNFSDKVNKKYLYFWLTSPIAKRKIDEITIGSTQKALTIVSLNNIEIDLPSITEQNKIVEVISAIQEKIELNQKMNETLEEIAKSLFKSWFVDFDPVKAKVEGRPTGLSKEISDLFPDSFEDSELGKIPKGWETIKLGDIATVTSGKKPPEKKERKSSTYPYEVFGGAGPIGFCGNSLEFSKPAIITGRVGTLGKVFFLDRECWVSDNSILICDAESYTPIIFQTLKHMNLSSLNVGSTQPLLTGRDIKKINIIGPDKRVLDKYVSTFNNLKIRQDKLIDENKTILKLKDTLLPKLISGELEILEKDNLIKKASI